jgi:hypothetical protein
MDWSDRLEMAIRSITDCDPIPDCDCDCDYGECDGLLTAGSTGTNANLLTSVHASYVQVCLKAKCYSTALPILESPLFEIKKETGIEPVDYLQYYYYGGMVYCGLKKFAKALEFFQMALTCPSKVLSAIQVEAYKKYVCCSLISTVRLTDWLHSTPLSRCVVLIACVGFLPPLRPVRCGMTG